jgi:hypothetical protein
MNATIERITRRDALAASARYAAAGAVAVLSAGLIAKGFVVPEDARCRVGAACRGCQAAANCGLPAAVRYRAATQPTFSRAACGPGVLPNDPARSSRG